MPVQLFDASERIVVKDSELPGVVDGDPETTYTLQPISIADHRRLQKQFTTEVMNRRTHQKDEQVDYDGLNDAVLDFVLLEWVGPTLKGEQAPCVLANKLKLDGVRIGAIKRLAGMNQIQRAPEVRAESFRESSPVLAVLGR